MPSLHAGVAIIGGGPMGAWLALEATRGLDPLRAPAVLFDGGDLTGVAGPLLAFDPDGRVTHGLPADLSPLLRDGAAALANFEPQTGRPIGHCTAGLVLAGGDSELGEPVDAAWLERRGLAAAGAARHLPAGAIVDPVRTHAEVLALARTRGAITRPGTSVRALVVEDGRVVGLETDRGPCTADHVVLTSATAAAALLPELLLPLIDEPWIQQAHGSRLVRAEAGLPETGTAALPPGGLTELHTDPMALEAFFATGEPLDAPHPALLWPDGRLVAPNPAAGTLVLVSPDGTPDGTPDETPGDTNPDAPSEARTHAPGHTDLDPPTTTRGSHQRTPDGLPLVGPASPHANLWLALGLSRAAPLLAPAIAPGLFAQLLGNPVAPFDPTKLAPARFR